MSICVYSTARPLPEDVRGVLKIKIYVIFNGFSKDLLAILNRYNSYSPYEHINRKLRVGNDYVRGWEPRTQDAGLPDATVETTERAECAANGIQKSPVLSARLPAAHMDASGIRKWGSAPL